MRVVRVNNEIFQASGLTPSESLDAESSIRFEEEVPEFPLVMVSWHDAWFDFDQSSPEDCRADYLVHTVGFLLSDGPRFISVAQEMLPDGDGFRAVTHIPVAIIESVTTLADLPHVQHG
jgi:hypothetical protein